jgi:hypothetical protein
MQMLITTLIMSSVRGRLRGRLLGLIRIQQGRRLLIPVLILKFRGDTKLINIKEMPSLRFSAGLLHYLQLFLIISLEFLLLI